MNEQKWKALRPIHRNGITGKTWCERGDIFYGNELLAFLEKEKAIEKVTTETVYRFANSVGNWEGIKISGDIYSGFYVYGFKNTKINIHLTLFEIMQAAGLIIESEEIVDHIPQVGKKVEPEPKLSITYGYQDKDNMEPKPEPKFKVGDRVKIIEAEDFNIETIGKIGTIQVCTKHDCTVIFDDNDFWHYDNSWLELAPEIPLIDGHRYRLKCINDSNAMYLKPNKIFHGIYSNHCYKIAIEFFDYDETRFQVLEDITESEAGI